jgi:hydrogenase expression/formation protein HypE
MMNSDNRFVTLAHGNGGRFMRELVDELFARHLANPLLDVRADAVALPKSSGDLMITTDGFTVQPLEFPGGDIGALAVHGTVNDLAVSGAIPRYLTLNAFIEEGLELARLERYIASLAKAARDSGVVVVAGDTKVVPRGQGDGLYLATTGVGVRHSAALLGTDRIDVGNRLVVSGPVGDHGIAVMLAREAFGLKGELESDCASVLPLATAALETGGVRFMRDPTRGGIATVAHEIAHAAGVTVRLREDSIPVRDPVRSVCEILGYDPYYLACEGRVVAVMEADRAQRLLETWRSTPGGEHAEIVGDIEEGPSKVVLETALGGQRFLDELEDDPLPRIC